MQYSLSRPSPTNTLPTIKERGRIILLLDAQQLLIVLAKERSLPIHLEVVSLIEVTASTWGNIPLDSTSSVVTARVWRLVAEGLERSCLELKMHRGIACSYHASRIRTSIASMPGCHPSFSPQPSSTKRASTRPTPVGHSLYTHPNFLPTFDDGPLRSKVSHQIPLRLLHLPFIARELLTGKSRNPRFRLLSHPQCRLMCHGCTR